MSNHGHPLRGFKYPSLAPIIRNLTLPYRADLWSMESRKEIRLYEAFVSCPHPLP